MKLDVRKHCWNERLQGQSSNVKVTAMSNALFQLG